MLDKIFSSEVVSEAIEILIDDMPMALWETIYVTVLSTLFAIVLGLPLGVLLVVGEKGGILPLPKWLMRVLNVPAYKTYCRNNGRYDSIDSSSCYCRISFCCASCGEQSARAESQHN